MTSVHTTFTPAHRGGSGPPLVCLHGFTDTWRTWELVLGALERRHEVLAPTLPAHAGAPHEEGDVTLDVVLDAVERAMDDAGFATAHLVGNSLGGFVALRLAARGRARSVVALAPAGGWEAGDPGYAAAMQQFRDLQAATRRLAPMADRFLATPEGRRRATALTCERFEHLPVELIAHQLLGVAACRDVGPMIDAAAGAWTLDAARIECPVRIVWGTADRLLPWPAAAVRFRRDWLPHADWVVIDDVGHAPQLDVPVEAAQLILGFTDR
jgi:pimeloyl-ACP methyl ester carboxylesterase